jgi:hypothetical protein
MSVTIYKIFSILIYELTGVKGTRSGNNLNNILAI